MLWSSAVVFGRYFRFVFVRLCGLHVVGVGKGAREDIRVDLALFIGSSLCARSFVCLFVRWLVG